MKINRIEIKNVKSFKDKMEIAFNNDFNIFIGPNGSGKSNLLDILTICIRQYFILPFTVNNEPDIPENRRISPTRAYNEIQQALDRFYDDPSELKIEIEFQIKSEDITNIKRIIQNILILKEKLKEFRNWQEYISVLDEMENWESNIFVENEIVAYKILNYNLERGNTDQENFFLRYLNFFEFLQILTKEISSISLNLNYLYFSPYRSQNLTNAHAILSEQNYYQESQSLTNSTSKSVFSLIKLATLYFAEKRRNLENEAKEIGYIQKWEADEEVKLVTKYLRKLGYSWELTLINKNKNIYNIVFTKEHKRININQASSGEKEIINFLLGVFTFNIKNGVIIIDEPELHLHPQWQNFLMDLFIELSFVTQNQFIISTHSAIFINEKSINHVFRIYRDENNVSKEITLKECEALSLKNLLHIVNSTNNEKIFFADVVILVEGITDRLVFQKILDKRMGKAIGAQIVEIIEIKGKNNFVHFKKFLSMLKIPTFFICDLDFINEIGPPEIKSLFITNEKKIEKDVLKNEKSKDGNLLVEEIERAIKNNNTKALAEIWDYIKSFRRKLKSSLNETEKKALLSFIQTKRENNIFILTLGDIEEYFPDEFKSKDLTNVLNLLEEDNYSEWQKENNFHELANIIDDILQKSKIKFSN